MSSALVSSALVSGALVPARIVWTNGAAHVEWYATDGRRYEEPFFEQTLRALARRAFDGGAVALRTPIDALAAAAPAVTPEAFIFHVSRCGSTLVCRMLATLDDSVVISEAPVLDGVLRGRRSDPAIDAADRVAWFRGAVAALCRAVPVGRRAFIKLDGWHLFELPSIRRAFPDTPFVFVHRDPLEVLVSLMRIPSVALVRDTVSTDELGIPEHVRDSLTREQLAAAVVGAYYRAAARHAGELTSFAYDRLPDVVWRSMPRSSFTAAEIDRMRVTAAQDAKEPGRAFRHDADEKRRAVTPALDAASTRWCSDAYAAWLAAIADPPAAVAAGHAVAGTSPSGAARMRRIHS